VEDQIVTVLDLREKQPVLAPSLFSFLFLEEWRECGKPLQTAGQQIACRKRIG
jgi:hypothetical protein